MLTTVRACLAREHGQTMSEYAIVLSVITLGALAVFTALSGGVAAAIATVAGVL